MHIILFTILHIIALTFVCAPNTMFFASANVLSQLLAEYFGEVANNWAFAAVTIPSIIFIPIWSFMLDSYGPSNIFPIIMLICTLCSIFSILSGYSNLLSLYIIGRTAYGVAGESSLIA